jgi:hypothetical protein
MEANLYGLPPTTLTADGSSLVRAINGAIKGTGNNLE